MVGACPGAKSADCRSSHQRGRFPQHWPPCLLPGLYPDQTPWLCGTCLPQEGPGLQHCPDSCCWNVCAPWESPAASRASCDGLVPEGSIVGSQYVSKGSWPACTGQLVSLPQGGGSGGPKIVSSQCPCPKTFGSRSDHWL